MADPDMPSSEAPPETEAAPQPAANAPTEARNGAPPKAEA